MATTWTAEKTRVGQNYVYNAIATHTQGDTLTIAYRYTPATGESIDLPTAATLKVTDDSTFATVDYTSTDVTITDNTTTYDLSFTVPTATTAEWIGRYWFDIEETLTSGKIETKVQGRITVKKDL